MSIRMFFLSVVLVVSSPVMGMYPLGIVAAAAGTYIVCTYDKHKTAWEIEQARRKEAAARERVRVAEERAHSLVEGSLELDDANAEVDRAYAELDDILEHVDVVLDKAAAQERERERYEQEPCWFDKIMYDAHKMIIDEQQRARDRDEEHDFFFNTESLAPEVREKRERLRLSLWDLKNPDNTQIYLKDYHILKERIEALKLAWHPDKQPDKYFDKRPAAKRDCCDDYYRIMSRSIDEYLAWLRSKQPDIDKRLKESTGRAHSNVFESAQASANIYGEKRKSIVEENMVADDGSGNSNEQLRMRRESITAGYVLVEEEDELEGKYDEEAALAVNVLNTRDGMNSMNARKVDAHVSALSCFNDMD